MNQRYQNEKIRRAAERYAGNGLYEAIRPTVGQLEAESDEFGLCPEECFDETVELLNEIAGKGGDILPETDSLWLGKENEYWRLDRSVSRDGIRRAVATVFGFVILAVDSSRHPFYRQTLARQLMQTVARHQPAGWASLLGRILSVPLPDGWFDAFIGAEPEDGGDVTALPKDLDTPRARRYFAEAVRLGYMEKADGGKYRWLGVGGKGVQSQLAYFCGRVYEYKYTVSGNAGKDFPEDSLNELFSPNRTSGRIRFRDLLSKVYMAQKEQQWRQKIDNIFDKYFF